jgi:hypothetical protein
MIQCPQCKRTLPDGNVRCQFCGADVSTIPRPVPVKKTVAAQAPGAPSWVGTAYYAVCGYYMLSGAINLVMGILRGPFVMLLGALSLIFGLGLIFKVDFIRGIANIICWIQIVFGILGLAMSFGWAMIIGPLAFLLIAMNVIQVCMAGFMIYLIGETDDFARI